MSMTKNRCHHRNHYPVSPSLKMTCTLLLQIMLVMLLSLCTLPLVSTFQIIPATTTSTRKSHSNAYTINRHASRTQFNGNVNVNQKTNSNDCRIPSSSKSLCSVQPRYSQRISNSVLYSTSNNNNVNQKSANGDARNNKSEKSYDRKNGFNINMDTNNNLMNINQFSPSTQSIPTPIVTTSANASTGAGSIGLQTQQQQSTTEAEVEPQGKETSTTDKPKLTSKAFNATFLILCFGFAAYSILSVDDGMTRGWSISEKAMRIPLDNWASYEASLNQQPVFTKTMINVVIYLLGDWLSQTLFIQRNLLEFDAWRTMRNGFIGMVFGPLVHEYYEFSDYILPVDEGMNRFYKIFMDQTIYIFVKCSMYIVAVNMLAGETFEYSKETAKGKIKGIMFTAWKFWPLVHCVTYGAIPARHRILWVNCVDLFWNAILASIAGKSKGDDDNDSENIVEGGGGNENQPQLQPLKQQQQLESSNTYSGAGINLNGFQNNIKSMVLKEENKVDESKVNDLDAMVEMNLDLDDMKELTEVIVKSSKGSVTTNTDELSNDDDDDDEDGNYVFFENDTIYRNKSNDTATDGSRIEGSTAANTTLYGVKG